MSEDTIMRPSAHFSAGIFILTILYYFGYFTGLEVWIVFLIGTIGLDVDYLLKYFITQKNHRKYWTHSPVFWTFIFLLAIITKLNLLFWFSGGVLLHLILDSFDWGIYLTPVNSKPLFPYLLKNTSTFKSEKEFSSYYWNNSGIRVIEGGLLFVSIISFLIIIQDLTLFLINLLVGISIYTGTGIDLVRIRILK